MIGSCLPQLRHVVEFIERLSGIKPASCKSAEQNPFLPANPRSPLLQPKVALRNDSSAPPIKIDTSSCSSVDSNTPYEPITLLSPRHLGPPSSVRSKSDTSDSESDSVKTRDSPASVFSDVTFVHSGTDPVHWLEEDLSEARREWPGGASQSFLPVDAMKRIVTIDSIEECLAHQTSTLSFGQPCRQLAERIQLFASKIFCILVLIRKGHCVLDFLEEDLDDSDLPLVRNDKNKNSVNFQLCSKKHPNQPIKAMEGWKTKYNYSFSREQWTVLVPLFNRSNSIEHQSFDNNTVFPFTRDEKGNGCNVKDGGFGTVWEVDIHPAHHSFHCKSLNPSFALKRLHSCDKTWFDSEVEMLKLFSDRKGRHDHLVKLLATYEFHGEFYLLFPWAKGNLRDYWTQTPKPKFSELTAKWLLRQCKGIASGLQRIHGYQATWDAIGNLASIRSSEDDPGHHCIESNERTYSRHGDLKPENILWSDEEAPDQDPDFNEQGILLISDFGSMKAYKNLTEFRRTPEDVRGSAPYEPPEVAVSRDAKVVSRAYDIWSLGCVYLEFVSWLVGSLEGLEGFRISRASEGHNEAFFIVDDDDFPGRSRRVVKESVRDWIKELRQMPRCSSFICDFLDLIVDDMLKTNPKDRIHCGPLNEKLSVMVKKGNDNPEYLLRRTPHSTDGMEPKTAGPEQIVHCSVSHMDGSPLPRRPSVEKNPAALMRPQPVLHAELDGLSKPSSTTKWNYL